VNPIDATVFTRVGSECIPIAHAWYFQSKVTASSQGAEFAVPHRIDVSDIRCVTTTRGRLCTTGIPP
jgi:hypothetical protein